MGRILCENSWDEVFVPYVVLLDIIYSHIARELIILVKYTNLLSLKNRSFQEIPDTKYRFQSIVMLIIYN